MNDIKIGSSIRNIKKISIGRNTFPVIFVNVGLTYDEDDIELEITKAKAAIDVGADIISDLSLCGNIGAIQERFMNEFKVPFSSVSIYEAYCEAKKNQLKISEQNIIDLFEKQVLRGCDVISIHATVRLNDRKLLDKTQRIIPCTSRGGSMMLEIMEKNNFDNPYYTYFDKVMNIAKKYNVCLSLAPTYRAGSICDCGRENELDDLELKRMQELVLKAQSQDVSIVIEGIGHAPLNEISDCVKKGIEICCDAPYRVLTVACDIALGYDHIASAIASSNAVMAGASSITVVTRSEHIARPNLEMIVEGVISAKIAAYCGYIARTKDFSRDEEMAKWRSKCGCLGRTSLALCPSAAVKEVVRTKPSEKVSCGMCGDFCPFEILSKKK